MSLSPNLPARAGKILALCKASTKLLLKFLLTFPFISTFFFLREFFHGAEHCIIFGPRFLVRSRKYYSTILNSNWHKTNK